MTDYQHWQLETDDSGTAWLCIDKQDASVNVLSRPVLEEFERILEGFEKLSPPRIVLYSGKESGFIAGADINEFPTIGSEQDAYEATRHGQRLLARLEALPAVTVAWLDGHALGGGLELALACDWRLAADTDRRTLGLPEVKLGVHPGFGGTVRAVRLMGVRGAMRLMLSGDSITPATALAGGLIDAVVPRDEFRSAARDFASRTPRRSQVPLLDRLMALSPVRGFVARQLRQQVARRAREAHYPAPYAMIRLWQQHAAADDAAYDAEARSFARLIGTETSRNLVRVYFLQERLKQQGTADLPPVEHVHVVGAGTMGGDIAAWCAVRGLTVTLQDREARFIEPALERAGELFAKRFSSDGDIQAARSRLSADVAGEGVGRADIVIEAIFEDLEVKQSLYRDLEPRMKPEAILATNTSSIPLEALVTCLANPERLIGVHFFNPVAKLPLVEIVRGQTSSDDAIGRGIAFTRQIGKLPLPCNSRPGFLVNRILGPYLSEAMELHDEGVPIAVIDRAATDFGMPMGPIELADSVGLDVALHVARILSPVVGRTVSPTLERKVADGELGRKSGRGFYDYKDGRPVRQTAARNDAPADLEDRLMLPLINEAAACLADGVVTEPDIVDAGVIFGTGFAPFRGGPLHYARTRGVRSVVRSLESLQATHGDRFKPSSGWAPLLSADGES